MCPVWRPVIRYQQQKKVGGVNCTFNASWIRAALAVSTHIATQIECGLSGLLYVWKLQVQLGSKTDSRDPDRVRLVWVVIQLGP